jgi:protein arginine kinase
VTLDLSLIPDGGLHWLTASGEHAGIVLSSRIRLARNIAGFAFPTRAREGERLRVLHQLRDAAARSASLRSAALVRVDECTAQERLLLHERHLVSRELAGLDRQQGVMATGAGAVLLTGEAGLMVNEEDHLRLQVFRSGFDVPGRCARRSGSTRSSGPSCRTRGTRSSASSPPARPTPGRGCGRRC